MDVKAIVHLSFSKFGGAGNISSILAEQQRILGFNAKHLSNLDFSIGLQPFRQFDVTLKALVDEYLVKNHEVKTLFSMYRGTKKLNLRRIDANKTLYHFHWTPGLITNKQIAELSKENYVFWTLHDMNPFTGGCHVAYGCQKFKEGCLDCPAVRKQFQKKVRSIYDFKKKYFSESNIILVAPSDWMRAKVIESKLFKTENIY